MYERLKPSRVALLGALVTALTALSVSSQSQLTLTAFGIGRGFTISTFASGFSSTSGIGPLGIGFNADGSVLVADYLGAIHKFATDTDGQVAAAGNQTSANGFAHVTGIAASGGNLYVANQSGGIFNLNANGTVGSLFVSGFGGATGLTTNPLNGHLFSTTGAGIVDVNVSAASFTNFNGVGGDGLSTDGVTLYVESGDHILGYRISDKALVYDSGFLNCGADGTALGSGSLAGFLYVNCNNGLFKEIKFSDNSINDIANSGSRGDFVQVDPTNGTLLITQSNSINRLTAPTGGGFGQTPEPGVTASLVGMSVAGAGLLLRRRSKK